MIYLSLGAGVQSSALFVMSALGLRGCPKADVAIFADTGDEPAYVYEQLKRLRDFAPHLPISTVTAGVLSEHIAARMSGRRKLFASIPAFTVGDDGRSAMLSRQCTSEYKIEPIGKEVRRLLGYKPRQRIKETAVALIGISVDEATRQKPSRMRWVKNTYPLIEARMTRSACLALLREHGLPEPQKSACVFCPFHDDTYWANLKAVHPVEFDKAVAVDESIRDSSRSGPARPVFLHRSLTALKDVVFNPKPRGTLFDGFENDCDGVCGV